jgi:cardiolipin synthase (CMP-forming)
VTEFTVPETAFVSWALGQIPNLISALRLVATPALVWLMVSRHFDLALLLCIPIGLSDWADGFLARLLHSTSRLGLYLDPVADKVLLVSAFLGLGITGTIPKALVILVMARDLIILAGVFLLWRYRGRTDFQPLLAGKISTTFQILTVLAALISEVTGNSFWRGFRNSCFGATAVFTALSGIAYVRKGIRMASTAEKSPFSVPR